MENRRRLILFNWRQPQMGAAQTFATARHSSASVVGVLARTRCIGSCAHGRVLPDHVIVAFANTGRKFSQTLRFVHGCGVH